MLPGRSYFFANAGNLIGAQITELKHKVNVNTLEHTAATHLELNEVGYCNRWRSTRRSRSIPTAKTARWAPSS